MYSKFDLRRPADFLRKSLHHTRTAFGPHTARDYGHIVHSMAFRRLQGKMQLFPPSESPLLRNRLSHTLEVTDIASRITANLNEKYSNDGHRIDGYMVTAVALAHDLGHPPFGHTGEKVLARLMSKHGSFEGNAQTLRILTRLENRSVHSARKVFPEEVYERPLGLNLLLRTIAGVIKYDKEIKDRGKKGANGRSGGGYTARGNVEKGYYEDDKEIVELVRSNLIRNPADDGRQLKTIECQIMDLADDIAYSTYDFEDCMIAGVTQPVDLIAIYDADAKEVAKRTSHSLKTKYGYSAKLDFVDILVVYEELFRSIIRMSGKSGYEDNEFDNAAYLGWNYQNSRQAARVPLIRRQLTEYLIQSAVNATKITKWDSSCPALTVLEIDPRYLLFIEALKHYNYIDVIKSRRLQLYAERAEEILVSLFEILDDDEENRLFPEYWKPYADSILKTKNSRKRRRLICDYLSSLTDDEAIKLYSRVASADPLTVFQGPD